MVDKERIELSSPGCKPGILPLNDSPTNPTAWKLSAISPIYCAVHMRAKDIGAGGDSRNPTLPLTGRLLFHLSYTGKTKGPQTGSHV